MVLIETVSPELVQSNIEVISHPITGAEQPPSPKSPYASLVRFYHAFNSRDSAAMEENWDRSGRCVMSNPLGGIKRGWDEIGEVYQKIFHGGATVYVEFYDYSLHESESVFYAVGHERGHITKDGEKMELRIRTSRIYHLLQGQWKQAHHHGSIDNPELLARYQAMVMRK